MTIALVLAVFAYLSFCFMLLDCCAVGKRYDEQMVRLYRVEHDRIVRR